MPRLSQSDEERERIRRRILDAARTLFDEAGIEAVSMRGIGRRVGLTASALYAYFPGKAELVRGLWTDALEDVTSRLRAISAAHADPLAAIRALALAYAAFAEEDPVRFRVLFLNDPTLARSFTENPDLYAPYFVLRERVEAAIRGGQIVRHASDCDLAAQAMWAAVHGVLVLNNNCTDFSFRPMRRLVATVVDAVLAGLTRPCGESGEGGACREGEP